VCLYIYILFLGFYEKILEREEGKGRNGEERLCLRRESFREEERARR
jgi:hypothetical protein